MAKKPARNLPLFTVQIRRKVVSTATLHLRGKNWAHVEQQALEFLESEDAQSAMRWAMTEAAFDVDCYAEEDD